MRGNFFSWEHFFSLKFFLKNLNVMISKELGNFRSRFNRVVGCWLGSETGLYLVATAISYFRRRFVSRITKECDWDTGRENNS